MTGDAVSISSSSLKERDHMSPATIAAFNKRRLHGDYGTQPNAPSVGVDLRNGAASTSAITAASRPLGPKLWKPEEHSSNAQRASTLASSTSSQYIPDAHYVACPNSHATANLAANSAAKVSGEAYGAHYQPDAYKWGHTESAWSHLGATRSSAAAARDEPPSNVPTNVSQGAASAALNRTRVPRTSSRTSSLASNSGLASTNQQPMPAIDIAKVLAQAQINARNRIDSADNHLPANFGVQSEEQKAERRAQVLNLISVADARVKARIAELNHDAQAPGQVFGSLEFQKIALEIATRNNAGNLANHGKLNLGGGLYMTQDEVDDIARRHVQPVLDKVQVVADKKRIADREHENRMKLLQTEKDAEKAEEKKRRAEERQLKADEKAARKREQALAKQKRERAAQRAKENLEPGSHLWHWQQVEVIKEDVKEAKTARDEQLKVVEDLQREQSTTQTELEQLVAKHHALKKEYFDRGEALEKKEAEYSETDLETVSVFDLKQQRETVKASTKQAKDQRVRLEQRLEQINKDLSEAEAEHKELESSHKELKKQYFAAKEEAEEAERKFQIEEEARLKREAEERRLAEEARQAEEARRAEEAKLAEEAKQQEQAKLAEAKQQEQAKVAEAKQQEQAKQSAKPAALAVDATSPTSKSVKSPVSAKSPVSPASPVSPVGADVKLPAKSQLLGLGDARSGPVLSGYKPVGKDSAKPADSQPAKPADSQTAKPADTKPAETKPAETKPADTKPATLTPSALFNVTSAAVAAQAVNNTARKPSQPLKPSTLAAQKTVVPVKAAVETFVTEKQKAESPKAVAGASVPPVSAGNAADIPLGDARDQFSGFESSNVREKKVDGVFKEEL